MPSGNVNTVRLGCGSAAGVNASYDSLNNRFVLANKTTGNLAITMQDNTGNFLGATGLW